MTKDNSPTGTLHDCYPKTTEYVEVCWYDRRLQKIVRIGLVLAVVVVGIIAYVVLA